MEAMEERLLMSASLTTFESDQRSVPMETCSLNYAKIKLD